MNITYVACSMVLNINCITMAMQQESELKGQTKKIVSMINLIQQSVPLFDDEHRVLQQRLKKILWYDAQSSPRAAQEKLNGYLEEFYEKLPKTGELVNIRELFPLNQPIENKSTNDNLIESEFFKKDYINALTYDGTKKILNIRKKVVEMRQNINREKWEYYGRYVERMCMISTALACFLFAISGNIAAIIYEDPKLSVTSLVAIFGFGFLPHIQPVRYSDYNNIKLISFKKRLHSLYQLHYFIARLPTKRLFESGPKPFIDIDFIIS